MEKKQALEARRQARAKADPTPIPDEIAELWKELDGWYCRTQDKELCGPYDSRGQLLADFR